MRPMHFGAASLLSAAALLSQQGPARPDGFDAAVAPLLQNHCVRCHDDDEPKADLALDAVSAAIDGPATADLWLRVLHQLQAGLMPPPHGRRQPTADERRRAVRWIEQAVIASGHGESYAEKLRLPQYGNWVDHASLFCGEHDEPPFTRARLWRKSPFLFASRRAVSREVKGVQNPFVFATPDNGIRDYAATSVVGASVVETSLLNASAELDWLLDQAEREAATRPPDKRRRSNPLAPFVGADATPTEAEMHAAIAPTFQRLVSREPSTEELARYTGLLQQSLRDTGDARASVRAALAAIYVSPEALYRMEWGLGETDAHGRRMLSPDELVFALSYALFDDGPFDGRGKSRWIGDAYRDGKLATRDDVRAIIDRVLEGEPYRAASARRIYAVPRVMRFFREYFGFDRATDVFKDDEHIANNRMSHDPRRLVADAEELIAHVLRQDRDVLRRLLTTTEALVYHNGDNDAPLARIAKLEQDLTAIDDDWARQQTERRLRGIEKKPKYRNDPALMARAKAKIRAEQATLAETERARLEQQIAAGPQMPVNKPRQRRYVLAYNLDPRRWRWPAEQPFELPAEQRSGILTHPAWLVAHSGNFDTDPIHRGIWVYEKLLCGVLADVPPDVDARVPEDPHKTLRERMAPLRERACWKCHHKINPLGEPFEVFDDFGRFRTHFEFDGDGALVPRGGVTKRPVDASGSFDGLGIDELQGDFDSALPMLRAIANTDRARQSFLRHLFRYFLGRNETLTDSRTLRALDRAYVDSGGSLRATLVELLSSDSFLFRR